MFFTLNLFTKAEKCIGKWIISLRQMCFSLVGNYLLIFNMNAVVLILIIC